MFVDYIVDVFEKAFKMEAVIYREQTYNYDWLLESYYRWMEYLKEEHIPPHSVVAFKGDFNPYSIGLLLALMENGNILVPISYAAKNPDDLILTAEAEYLITISDQDVKTIKTDIEARHEILLKLKENKHPGLILFSSGTTGKPKAAVHDIIPLLEKFKVPGKALRTIAFLLFDHIGGLNTLLYVLSNAGTIVAIEDRLPDEVCRLIQKYQVELLPTSPTFINMILYSRAYERYDISCLKIVSYGTEPMPHTTLTSFHRLFPHIQLKQTYGLSEIGIMRSRSESSDSLWVKVGGEDYETRIIDGRLWIKAKTAMLGYLNAPSPFTDDGWFDTGDRVEVKDDYIRFLGRESEIINVGGEKVCPTEVESVLLEIEGVKDVVVRGETHQLMGNIVVANVVVAHANNTPTFAAKIRSYCKSRLEKYKVPVKIHLTEDSVSNERFKKKR